MHLLVPICGGLFFFSLLLVAPRQVEIFALWAQWLRADVLRGGNVVYINLDETSVERLSPHRRGHVLSIPRAGVSASLVHERISRAESHGHLTLVALICSDPTLQPLLPQIFLTKDAKLTVAERVAFRALPAPLHWFRGTDGWVTAANFPGLLTFIRRQVLLARPGCQIVLLMDCASQHMANNVLAHCRRLRLLIMFVPARLTWLLQPLDSHVFATFKRRLHAFQLEARAAHESGALQPAEWVALLANAVFEVLVSRVWTQAFNANGVTGLPHAMRPRVLELLGSACHLPLRAPSANELFELIGRIRPALPVHVLFWPEALLRLGGLAVVPRAVPLLPPPLPPPAEPPPDEGGAPGAPISARTRSRTRLVL